MSSCTLCRALTFMASYHLLCWAVRHSSNCDGLCWTVTAYIVLGGSIFGCEGVCRALRVFSSFSPCSLSAYLPPLIPDARVCIRHLAPLQIPMFALLPLSRCPCTPLYPLGRCPFMSLSPFLRCLSTRLSPHPRCLSTPLIPLPRCLSISQSSSQVPAYASAPLLRCRNMSLTSASCSQMTKYACAPSFLMPEYVSPSLSRCLSSALQTTPCFRRPDILAGRACNVPASHHDHRQDRCLYNGAGVCKYIWCRRRGTVARHDSPG